MFRRPGIEMLGLMSTRSRWRLSATARKTVLLMHIAAAGVWLGLDVAMAVLVFTAIGTDSPDTRGFALQALQLVTVWPMLAAAATSLVTGVLLGMGSKYGLLRYWWVLVKLVLNLVLATLVVVALRGGVNEAAEVGRHLSAGIDIDWRWSDLIFPPIVSPAALLFAFVLSVFKPWGRTGWGRQGRGTAAGSDDTRAESDQAVGARR